ncbi:MAG: AMP-binding enzyme, partial [Candidatus Dormibacteraceae bacterium]
AVLVARGPHLAAMQERGLTIREAVCFGEPDQMLGEVPVAAIVVGGEVSDRELRDYCREHLAGAKVPVRLYRTETIPRTATGTVQRRAVAAAFAAP